MFSRYSVSRYFITRYFVIQFSNTPFIIMIHPICKLVESSVLLGVCETFLVIIRAFKVENVAYLLLWPFQATINYVFVCLFVCLFFMQES